ncbi:ribosomal protein S18-alanine N-acetyltransferase [Arsukibacterium sp. MJ3]|uniref:ribosomal protein S18-alanine N-acetyltransferase n=1 Tax=Arsukibacterium sp. MJ3 TaxID=1632859 RepID=UPI000A758DF7|nr:ribosomal protein S18-alanine N-acetyltransferase [Arsukibacterium sp. MJ3]
MQIRRLLVSDIPALLAIEAVANLYPWSEGVVNSCFGNQYFNYGLFVDAQLLGFYFGQFITVESQLFNICVHSKHHGRGLGGTLLTHFIEQSANRSAAEAWLEVRASNAAAIHLYEKHGFIEAGRRRNYYSNAAGKEDALMMCLPLSLTN